MFTFATNTISMKDDTGIFILAVILSYLLGSIPSGYILVKLKDGKDIREFGSGGTGATNVSRVKGWKHGIIIGLIDALKGFLPVLVVTLVLKNIVLSGACALSAVAGHCYPFSIGFRGGKGVATSFGSYLAVDPALTLISFAIFALIIAITKYVSLASICIISVMPLIFYFCRKNIQIVPWSIAIALLVIFRHRDNIIRLFKGNENKIGSKIK